MRAADDAARRASGGAAAAFGAAAAGQQQQQQRPPPRAGGAFARPHSAAPEKNPYRLSQSTVSLSTAPSTPAAVVRPASAAAPASSSESRRLPAPQSSDVTPQRLASVPYVPPLRHRGSSVQSRPPSESPSGGGGGDSGRRADGTCATEDEEPHAEPGVLPLRLHESYATKRMNALLSRLAMCRTVLRKAWGNDVGRPKQERAFLLHESERLKDVVAKVGSRGPVNLTDHFWSLADQAMLQAKDVISRSVRSSFAGCRSVVPAELLAELSCVRPPSRFQSLVLSCAATVPIGAAGTAGAAGPDDSPSAAAAATRPRRRQPPRQRGLRRVTCLCRHPTDPVVYCGCANGDVLSVALDAPAASQTALPFGHAYGVVHILCSPIRERGSGGGSGGAGGSGGGGGDIFVVTCSLDKSIRLYSLSRGRIHRAFTAGHEGVVSAACVWGGQLVTAGNEGRILVWDVMLSSHSELLPQTPGQTQQTPGRVPQTHVPPRGKKKGKGARGCGGAAVAQDKPPPARSLLASGQLLCVGYATGAVDVYASPNATVLNSTFEPPPVRLCLRLRQAAPVRREVAPLAACFAASPSPSSSSSSPPREAWRRGTTAAAAAAAVSACAVPTPADTGHLGAVTCMALQDDMSTFFTGGDDAHLVKWRLHERARVWKLKAHSSALTAVATVGPRLVATSSEDGLVKLWDETASAELCCVHHHRNSVAALVVLPASFGRDSAAAAAPAVAAAVAAATTLVETAAARLKRKGNDAAKERHPGLITACRETAVELWEIRNGGGVGAAT